MPSTVIQSHDYVPQKEILLITFTSGRRYEYFDVTQQEYEAFKAAFSKGIFFNKYIKPNHRFKRLKD